jgi:hypothetical protein
MGTVGAAAIAFGIFAAWKPPIAVIVGLLVAVWFVKDLRRRFATTIRFESKWIPMAWLILFIVSNWKLSGRSPLAAVSGNLTVENKVELVAYALVAALCFVHLYPMGRASDRVRIGPLMAWPLLALISGAWSLIPAFSFIRSLQLFVPIALCIFMVRVWREDQAVGEMLWRLSLRLIVQLITLLVILGLATRGQWPEGRFTWPGSPHPIVSSGIVGLGLLVLLVGGRSFVGFSLLSYAARIVLFAAALLFGQTRSALLGVALAVLVALWLAGRNRPGARYLTLPVYLGTLGFIVASAWGTVLQYIQRGQYGGVATLNGRLPLWMTALRDVAASGRWFVGSGYGSTRVILFPQVSFAGEAHNSWLQFLIELGAIGVILAIAWVGFLAYRLFRHRAYFPVRHRVAASLLVYLLVLSGADNYLTTPGFAYTAILLFYALALAPERDHREDLLRPGTSRVGASTSTARP